MHKIALVTNGEDRLPEGIAARIREFADFRAKKCASPDDLLESFGDAEILWGFGPDVSCMDPRVLARMPGLKALFRSGSGVDALPCAWAKEHGVGIYNTPESIAECVAEHAVALLISFIRQIPQYNARAKAGYPWGKVEGMDWHISHRTLGLVGYGNIARRVEKMMGGFDMRVLHYDPFVPGSLPLETVLKESDYVSVHCPLLPETAKLINAERLAMMKPNAILVNTSRGGVIDEDALADALDRGVIGGAALDVMASEPPDVKSRLLQHPKCVVTPHIAAFSCDFEKNFFDFSVKKLQAICAELDEGKA
jgi:phosphoglycerate dehydrogenase-like enzyme